MTANSNGQGRTTATATSATQVSAEMTKGKLNPAHSKPGDQVTLKLNEDVKSNGDVVIKKGATITGVVRNVKRIEGKGEAKGQAQSMIEVDWLAPAVQGGVSHRLSIALQSVSQINPLHRQRQEEAAQSQSVLAESSAAGSLAGSAGGGGGLLGGAVGGVTGAVGTAASVSGSVLGSSSSTISSATGSVGTARSNAALLSMPSVVAADAETDAALQNSLGMSSSGQLFMVGRGEVITAGGSKQSLDIYSHLNNDTVVTSPSRNFEISSGAQVQLLIGVQKN
jgi:hypothetical protein